MNRADTYYARSLRSSRSPASSPCSLRTRRAKNWAAQPLLRVGVTGALAALALPGLAQSAPQRLSPPPPQPRSANAPGSRRDTVMIPNTSNHIVGDSATWHLDWNGTSGTLTRRALGSQAELSLPLLYAHTEPGPKGYAKYLTWFLARDNDHFTLAWCYLNETGKEFYTWLYQFPSNQLTAQRFTGDYRFMPLREPVAPVEQTGLNYTSAPSYSGPDFTFRDWTRRAGTLDQLTLAPTRVVSFAAPLDGLTTPGAVAANMTPTGTAQTRTLSGLRVSPLHEIHVARGNGWRAGGWRELHALAYDSANDPYYLIMYSNVTKGYVVDLKRAQTYVADFGQRVAFAENAAVFGANEDVIVGPPDVRFRRYARVEIPLVAATSQWDNAYKDEAFVEMEFRSPEGKTLRVPCFWDGAQTWLARFAPTQIGTWSWRSYSDNAELNGQTGSFTCIADDTGSKGFLSVRTGALDGHEFVYSNGQPFSPSYLREPTFNIPVASLSITPAAPTTPPPASSVRSVGLTGSAPVLTLAQTTTATPATTPAPPAAIAPTPPVAPVAPAEADLTDSAGQAVPRSYRDWTRRVDQAVTLGFNRFWGGYVLDPVAFTQHTQVNEGGAPFLNYDLDRINPAFFQAMDRRIAYCNDRGIVPDIGLTELSGPLAAAVSPEKMSRLWRYVVARYAGYNVCWNLFGTSADRPLPAGAEALVTNLALQTRRNDPNLHPITTVWPNAEPLSAPKPVKKPTGPVTFTPDRGSNTSGGDPATPNPDFSFQIPNGGGARGGGSPQSGRGAQGTQGGQFRQRGGNGGNSGNMQPGQGEQSGTGGTDTPAQSGAASGRGARRNATGGTGGTSGTGGLPTPQSGGGTSGSGTNGNRGANGGGTGRTGIDRTGADRNAAGGGRSGSGANGGSNPGANGFGGNGAGGNNFGGNNFGGGGFGGNGLGGFGGQGGFGAGGDPNGGSGFGQGGFNPQRGGGARGSRRGGRSRGVTPGADVNLTEPSSDYVTIADPSVSSAALAERRAQKSAAAFQPVIPLAGASWLDAITITGGSPTSLGADYALNKPLVLEDTKPSATPDAARYRIWETIMRGGYWANGVSGGARGPQPLDDQITQWQIAATSLLQQTKSTRLTPHQEMLGGQEESVGDRRRRRKAESESAAAIAAAKAASAAAANQNSADDNGDFGADAGYDETKPPPTPPIYVLASPGWEYVVYFQSGGTATLDLLEATGNLRQSWYNPRTGKFASQTTTPGGSYKTFIAPDSKDWVLYLSRRVL